MKFIKVNLRVRFREDTPQEFIETLTNEIKSLAGFDSVDKYSDNEFEYKVVDSSSAHYVLKKWLDRGILKEV